MYFLLFSFFLKIITVNQGKSPVTNNIAVVIRTFFVTLLVLLLCRFRVAFVSVVSLLCHFRVAFVSVVSCRTSLSCCSLLVYCCVALLARVVLVSRTILCHAAFQRCRYTVDNLAFRLSFLSVVGY